MFYFRHHDHHSGWKGGHKKDWANYNYGGEGHHSSGDDYAKKWGAEHGDGHHAGEHHGGEWGHGDNHGHHSGNWWDGHGHNGADHGHHGGYHHHGHPYDH